MSEEKGAQGFEMAVRHLKKKAEDAFKENALKLKQLTCEESKSQF